MTAKKERLTAKKEQETVYSRNELINAAFSFGVKPEVMAGALRMAGKDNMTKADAAKAIRAFKQRRVK